MCGRMVLPQHTLTHAHTLARSTTWWCSRRVIGHGWCRYHLWILLSGVNFPDVMTPFYQREPLAAIYFLAFLLVGYFFLARLVLAIAFNSYKQVRRCGWVAQRPRQLSRRLHRSHRLLHSLTRFLPHPSPPRTATPD